MVVSDELRGESTMYLESVSTPKSCNTQIELINTFRKLWEQHVMWTRSFLISAAANLGDLEPVTNRLLRNPTDFAKVLSKYYGEEKARRFESLLTEHIVIAASIVNAAKAGNTDMVNEERKKWYANADQIAEFLSSLNPYWSRTEWQMMLYDHLKLLEVEVVERLQGQFAKDVAQYDIIEDQALMMGDLMASGIKKQFNL